MWVPRLPRRRPPRAPEVRGLPPWPLISKSAPSAPPSAAATVRADTAAHGMAAPATKKPARARAPRRSSAPADTPRARPERSGARHASRSSSARATTRTTSARAEPERFDAARSSPAPSPSTSQEVTQSRPRLRRHVLKNAPHGEDERHQRPRVRRPEPEPLSLPIHVQMSHARPVHGEPLAFGRGVPRGVRRRVSTRSTGPRHASSAAPPRRAFHDEPAATLQRRRAPVATSAAEATAPGQRLGRLAQVVSLTAYRPSHPARCVRGAHP